MIALWFLLFAGLAAIGLLALEYDLLAHFSERTAAEDAFEIGEILAISSVLLLGLLGFGGRTLYTQRREIRRRVAAERHALELAFHDPLTGLPNRRHFMDELGRALSAPPRGDNVHAVFLMDLNDFKAVNDVHGHASGDQLLIEVAQALSEAVGRAGLLARLGGDEFAAVARDLEGPEGATGIARRLVAALDRPFTGGGAEHRVGLGVGIALSPQDGSEAAELVRRADVALYRAKAAGGSLSSFFEPEMDAHLRERTMIERELRTAIATEAILPRYQPNIDLATGAVTGFELRPQWVHGVLGLVPATRFVPVAEDSGLIRGMSELLLRRACRDALAWPSETVLSVQLATALLRDGSVGLRVLAILAETGLPPDRLEVAISETALVRHVDTARIVLGGLREAGVRIALAGFGTSYSSLRHLRDFRFDRVKIDRSFVDDVTSNRNSAVVIQAILGLGQGLGMAISAEGIEQPEQLDLLREKGLEQGQGHLFGQALSAADAVELIAAGPRAAAPSRAALTSR